ncbi:MAG TPA: TadE/TadG family type IV pilus assembly protein [Candidatus Polarisedimenticolia bacterium]|nr:TadE/TadG family type IV pilus assembly protein [Candidatus Polarisedimenticolia bacterium]
MKRLRAFGREDAASAIVEFAIVVPTLILVLVACLDFARAVNAYGTVANASREGARYAAVHPSATDADVKAYLAGRIAPLDYGRMEVSVSSGFVRTPDPRWTASAPAPGTVTVRVTYPWEAATFVIGTFFSAAGSRTCAGVTIETGSCIDVSSSMESFE